MKKEDTGISPVVTTEGRLVTAESVKQAVKGKAVMPPERWDSLIEDCKEIIVEHVTRTREAIIEMKWHLGDRLMEEGEEEISQVLQRIAEELHVGERDLWYCLAFRKKFPRLEEVWQKAPEGKNISWHKLCNHYIDFTMPKPEIPVEEQRDKWGLMEWWATQPDLAVLRLVNKDLPFTLVVRVDKKGPALPEKQMHLRDVYKELGEYYIALKKWDSKDLDRGDYGRMNRALKQLLEKAKFDKDKVKHAIKWCAEQYVEGRVDWTLETVVKKYAEAVRPVKDYEKFVKKGRHG